MMSDDDNDGQMIFGDLGGPKASWNFTWFIFEFYEDGDYSQVCDGKNYFVFVKKKSSDTAFCDHVQKCLVLWGLKDLYTLFYEKNRTLPVGFSKFV